MATFAYLAGDGSTIGLTATNETGSQYTPHLVAIGDVAHDAADEGRPVKVGGKAVSARPTAVAANDRANALFGLFGQLFTSSLPMGTTSHKLVSAASTNATSVLAAAGKLLGMVVSNVNAAVRYFKLYDKASAPTVGSDTIKNTFLLPVGNQISIWFGDRGLTFTAGIAYALTTEATDAGTTGVSANEHIVNLWYLADSGL